MLNFVGTSTYHHQHQIEDEWHTIYKNSVFLRYCPDNEEMSKRLK